MSIPKIPENCPIKSLEECRKRRCTIEYPNGKPGQGLWEQVTKPYIHYMNCWCLWGFYQEHNQWILNKN